MVELTRMPLVLCRQLALGKEANSALLVYIRRLEAPCDAGVKDGLELLVNVLE